MSEKQHDLYPEDALNTSQSLCYVCRIYSIREMIWKF